MTFECGVVLCRISSVLTSMRGFSGRDTVPGKPIEATNSGSTRATPAPWRASMMPVSDKLTWAVMFGTMPAALSARST